MKKLLFAVAIFFSSVLGAYAIANCDNQAKPAFGCPEGYSMMCSPVGGDHWGCGKVAGGMVIEGTPSVSAEAAGVKSTMQTQVRMAPTSSKGTGDANDTERLLPTVNKINDIKSGSNSERLLPTVNKKSGEATTVRGWDAEKKEIIIGNRQAIGLTASSTARAHMAPEAIQNTDDLKTLAAQTMESDESIENVTLNASGTEIGYDVPGKLFWFIPIHMTARVQVASGKVKVNFPWYRTLISSALNLSDDGLNTELTQNIKVTQLQNALQKQAQEFQTLTNILKARHDASQQAISNIK